MSKKLWGGRFGKRMDPGFEKFSRSLKWDWRLAPYDLKIDAAHVNALRACGVLTRAESIRLLSAIRRLLGESRKGALRLPSGAEDVHSAVEIRIRESAGPAADKLHTARSRNDLVSQSTRLYCKEHAERIYGLISDAQRALVAKADRHKEVLVPGMTHLQNAQVVSLAHILLAYAEMLERAKSRLANARTFFDVCVLGSGALAGVTFPLDQKRMARELGLSRVVSNSYDVAGDRDFVLNFLSCMLILGLSLSRIAEDLLLAQLRGGTLIQLDPSFCTGSSMMPQKKNADFAELLRGAVGVFFGNFAGFAATLKGLPTSYNRDLQWDKKFLFDSVETCEEILPIVIRAVQDLRVDEEQAKKLVLDDGLYATDLADYLVRKGEPFRQAHEQVGRIVCLAEESGTPVSKIGLDLLKQVAPCIDGDVYDLFAPRHSVRLKKTSGSTHPAEVAKQIKRWKTELAL